MSVCGRTALVAAAIGMLAALPATSALAAPSAPSAASCAAQEEEENAGGATPAHLSDKWVFGGEEVNVSGDCFTPGETVDVDFHTVAVLVGTTVADGNGAASTTITIPEKAQCGAHTISMTGEASGHVAVASLQVVCVYNAGGGSGPPKAPNPGPKRQPKTPSVEPTAAQQEPPAVLPFTGARSGPLSATGAAFVVVGGLLVAGGRRRYLARHAARG